MIRSQLLEAFVQYGIPVLATALASLATVALGYLAKWLKARAESHKAAAVGARLVTFTDVVVADLEATIRPDLGIATADGKLTKAEREHLRNLALNRLKLMATTQGLEEAKQVLQIAAPKLDDFLMGLIETAVARLKPSKPGLAESVVVSSKMPIITPVPLEPVPTP